MESRPSFVDPAALVFAMLNKLDQIKQFIKLNEAELILAIGVIFVSLISFAAGRLLAPGQAKQAIYVEQLQASAFQNITGVEEIQEFAHRTKGVYVASKNSTKYHLPDCTGAKRIAEHNKIWFTSKEEAEGLGY